MNEIMTEKELRDHFASQAVLGMFSCEIFHRQLSDSSVSLEEAANGAYAMADELMKARE